MKVILQQDVRGKGKKGQMVEVSDGYARNFLFPKKLALEATKDNVNTMQQQEKARKEREQKAREEAVALSARLKDMPVHVKAKAGTGGPAVWQRHHQGDLRGAEGAVRRGHSQDRPAVRPHQGLRRLPDQGKAGL